MVEAMPITQEVTIKRSVMQLADKSDFLLDATPSAFMTIWCIDQRHCDAVLVANRYGAFSVRFR